jgi:predicted nucleic acid-binding OB-fold protein
LQDIYDLAIIVERKEEPMISFEEFKKKLKLKIDIYDTIIVEEVRIWQKLFQSKYHEKLF